MDKIASSDFIISSILSTFSFVKFKLLFFAKKSDTNFNKF